MDKSQTLISTQHFLVIHEDKEDSHSPWFACSSSLRGLWWNQLSMNKKLEEGCSGEQVVAFSGTCDFTMMQEEPSGVLAKYQRLYGNFYFGPAG